MPRIVPLTTALPPDDLALLRRLGEAASHYGVQLWVVGGAVRDALLGLHVLDIDITSETAADELAPLLAKDTGGRITARSQFGTVKLRFDGRTLDLATARSERYIRPGALPAVSPGTMREDLARRDFSINAMAASLAPDNFAVLLDTEGGFEDLELRQLRVLHERSFQDDATRMLRAVRYATRLGFRLERRTLRWLRRDLAYMDAISPPRVRRELARVLEEERAIPMLLEAHRLGILGAIHPALGTQNIRDSLRRAAHRKLGPVVLIGALVHAVPAYEISALSKRLDLTSRQRGVVQHVVRLRRAEPEIAEASLGDVDAIAASAPREAIMACAAVATSRQVREKLHRYLRVTQHFRMPLTGDDLLAMGIPPGPQVGRLLRLLRKAALEGQVRSRKGAEALVNEALQEAMH